MIACVVRAISMDRPRDPSGNMQTYQGNDEHHRATDDPDDHLDLSIQGLHFARRQSQPDESAFERTPRRHTEPAGCIHILPARRRTAPVVCPPTSPPRRNDLRARRMILEEMQMNPCECPSRTPPPRSHR